MIVDAALALRFLVRGNYGKAARNGRCISRSPISLFNFSSVCPAPDSSDNPMGAIPDTKSSPWYHIRKAVVVESSKGSSLKPFFGVRRSLYTV